MHRRAAAPAFPAATRTGLSTARIWLSYDSRSSTHKETPCKPIPQ
ncbi:hypothetical protein BN931_1127 [Bifidobacterium animalis subsp. lactis CECT 8145]|nr:hypothetical protein W91_0482 [Bifidobacterium animalis subsp. lactis Bi-07]AJD33583.1 hypothetical protein BAA6_0470 [Bifidobacterium animalis]QIR80499.1 hypothetical protein M8PIadj_0480 [Bifidobacterium animalis]CDL71913.1 hypothetical protein BN931_1127 [Bifidobacterium animalis subsp. lactis CECT 8145]